MRTFTTDKAEGGRRKDEENHFRPSSNRLHPSSFRLHPSDAGFTLIEILVVLVIVGIAIALISVNFNRDSKAVLRDQSERLALLLQAARTEAISTGKSLAWIGEGSAYGFYRRDEDRRWTTPFSDPPLTKGNLASPITLVDMKINGARVPIATPVVFSSSGLNAPFQLELGTADARMLVVGESGGNIYAKDEGGRRKDE